MNRALQKLIFAGCRDLGLDADARHDLQLAATGKTSLSDMTDAEMKLVIERLKKAGFKVGSNVKQKRPAASRGDLRFVHVLWRLLGEAGALSDPSRAGLNAFVRSSFGEAWGSVPADIDMLRDAARIDQVVQALKSWARRKGVGLDHGRMQR